MTLQDFIRQNNLPEVKKIGTLHGITYYIQKEIPDDVALGIPLIIKSSGMNYLICTSDECLEVIRIFYE